MSALPLRLGPLQISGYAVKKSGIVWLYPDGAVCEKNQIVGFCNINLEPLSVTARPAFASETTLQATLGLPASGRLRTDPETSFGGYLNFLGVQAWDCETAIAFLETDGPGYPLRMFHCMVAGKLLTALANYGTGLLPGWHRQVRAWRQETAAVPGTILSLAMCDARGPLLGDHAAFLEYFEGHQADCHLVLAANDLLVPTALSLLEQFSRHTTHGDFIAQDIQNAMFNGPIAPTPQDYFFAGTLLDALRSSPIRETHDIITSAGLQKSQPPTAIIISAGAEPLRMLRHKRLGYHLQIQHFQFAAAGPAVRTWLQTAFEKIPRTIADIKRDYETLIDAVSAEIKTKFLILNRMSSSGREDLAFYSPFDAPLSETLVHIAAKEINLMLHDLACHAQVEIVDVDAIAADLGGAQHLPDGVHQSGEMQARLRAEILRLAR